MPKLFSYVVDHDFGFAPNPWDGYCTLVHCKFGGSGGKRSIVELAKLDDWIIGTGGSSKHSAGHGKIIYLMRVDEKLKFKKFLKDPRFHGRADCVDQGQGNKYALVAHRYYYYGKNAVSMAELPDQLSRGLAKKGPGFRSDYSEDKLMLLLKWLRARYEQGMHGDPCASLRNKIQPRLKCKMRS
jgi:hypothetical protein